MSKIKTKSLDPIVFLWFLRLWIEWFMANSPIYSIWSWADLVSQSLCLMLVRLTSPPKLCIVLNIKTLSFTMLVFRLSYIGVFGKNLRGLIGLYFNSAAAFSYLLASLSSLAFILSRVLQYYTVNTLTCTTILHCKYSPLYYNITMWIRSRGLQYYTVNTLMCTTILHCEYSHMYYNITL